MHDRDPFRPPAREPKAGTFHRPTHGFGINVPLRRASTNQGRRWPMTYLVHTREIAAVKKTRRRALDEEEPICESSSRQFANEGGVCGVLRV